MKRPLSVLLLGALVTTTVALAVPSAPIDQGGMIERAPPAGSSSWSNLIDDLIHRLVSIYGCPSQCSECPEIVAEFWDQGCPVCLMDSEACCEERCGYQCVQEEWVCDCFEVEGSEACVCWQECVSYEWTCWQDCDRAHFCEKVHTTLTKEGKLSCLMCPPECISDWCGEDACPVPMEPAEPTPG